MKKPRVFEAANGRLLRPRSYAAEAFRHRVFLQYWVRRNLASRYRQTTLGPMWALLQPVLSGLVYAFVFSWLLKVQTAVPYAVFIVTNLALWSYTARTITTGSTTLLGNLDLITRIQFPREFLPLAVWIESVIDLALALCVAAAFFIAFDVPVPAAALLVIPIFVVHSILTLGLTLLTAALTIAVRDLAYIVPLLLQLALYLAPVLYPLDLVPPAYRDWYLLNPLAAIFAAYQEVLYGGTFTLGGALVVSAGISLALLAAAYVLFKRQEWKLADLL